MPFNAQAQAPTRPQGLQARFSDLLDPIGLLLLVATAGWLLLAGQVNRADAGPTLSILLLAAAGYAAASLIARRHDYLVPLIVITAAAVFAVTRLDILLDGPLRAPLGYSNATGSLYLIAASAGIMLLTRVEGRSLYICGVVATLAFGAVPWLNRTSTAAVLLGLPLLALLATDRRRVRSAIAGFGLAASATLAMTLVSGYTYAPEDVPRIVATLLSERRLMLWHDAIELILARPLFGVGPGMFPAHSATAIADPDTLWPHNEFLHFGAETGFIGSGLLLALFAWGFARLWWSPADRCTAVASAVLAAVAIHASVDYVLHYPAVPVAAAALLGAGVNRGKGAPGRSRVARRGVKASPVSSRR